MNKNNIVKSLALIVMVSGVFVMFGWFLDIDIIKSILEIWVTMKFTTALSFVMSGIILYAIVSFVENKRDIALLTLPISTLVIFLLMVTLLLSSFFGIRTGIEDLFVKESAEAIKTTIPGRPSVGTMVNFIFMALSGIIVMVGVTNYRTYLSYIGWVIFAVGSVALGGYFVDAPILYYTLEGLSTAMAVHTAILFVILGLGLVILTKDKI
jgi:hypothetical protein